VAAPPPPEAAPADRMRRGYARAEERNAQVRAQLEPLAPEERPMALVIAAALAAILAIANVVAWLAGLDVDGKQPGAFGVVLFAALMLLAAWGMWERRYWAVLGFEALLAITLCIAALSLLVASNVAAVVLCVAILGPVGWLFWKLVRVMGRIQAPQRVR
jgi:cation transport ATPase